MTNDDRDRMRRDSVSRRILTLRGASLTTPLARSHRSHPRRSRGETPVRSGKKNCSYNPNNGKGSLHVGGCPLVRLAKCASAVLDVRGERAPCVSGEAEHRARAVLGVAHGDHVLDVGDFDAVTAVGVAVAGLAPAAAACSAHVSVTSAIRSSDRERESASSRRSSNICAA